MKRVLLGIVSGGLFLALASQSSFAQMCEQGPGSGFQKQGVPMMSRAGHDRGAMMKREHHFSKMLVAAGLDEKQMDSVRAIRSRVRKDSVRKRAEIEVARLDLRDQLSKEQVDMASVEATVKKMAGLQSDIRLAHIKAIQEIKAVMTPEQRKKFKELREKGMQERTGHPHWESAG